jgi:hypothetical protein
MRNRKCASVALAAGLMLLSGRSFAAVITWGSATNIAGDSDVVTTGSLIGAFNLGTTGVADTTVNGVDFIGMAATGPSVSMGNFSLASYTFSSNSVGYNAAPFSNFSAGYQGLLSSSAGSSGGTFTLTITGLSVGDSYVFEFWSNASQGAAQAITALAGNNVTLNPNTTSTLGGVGQFATGTFTADSATQSIDFDDPVPNHLNGFQLRDTTVTPEPSSLSLLALGALSVIRRRRFARSVR